MELDEIDKITLERLNQEYVDAFMNADVEWYREHLADDFVVIESDGSVFNKTQFLSNTAKGPDVENYTLQDVNVRIYGNVALFGRPAYGRESGSKGMSRYFDVYVKAGGKWKTVSAQITRTSQA